MKSEFDIIIVGAGLAGLTTALACAQSGASVAIVDRQDIGAGQDPRVSALATTSLNLFANLGIDIAAQLQPIHDMLVTEGTPHSPWRLHFAGAEASSGSLGAIIENRQLKAALMTNLSSADNIVVFGATNIDEFKNQADCVTLALEDRSLSASLLVAADGRESVIRRKSGITVQRFDYDAASLVTLISHAMPHEGLAWQRIIKGGALAALPLTGNRSQIVWSGPSKAIAAAQSLSDAGFLALLSEKMDGYLGEMTLLAPRQSYPLRLQIADRFSSGRVALVGDAAHVIHPLAGQGLNLGLRDAAALAEGIKTARATGQDLGVASLLDYETWRNVDTRALGALTHMVSEASGSKIGAIGHLRRLGMAATNRSALLKNMLGKRAAGESETLPELMQNCL